MRLAFSSLLIALLAVPALAQGPVTAPPPATPAQDPPKKEEAKPADGAKEDPALAAIGKFIKKQGGKIDKSRKDWKLTLPKPEKATFDPDSDYFWNLKTNCGDIKIRLLPAVAPMHVTSFMYLTQLGYFDGVTFHRVIPGFMAQGGDPLGTGSGNPGYQMGIEVDPKVKHDHPGVVSTARTMQPNTDGSQFFICFAPIQNPPQLDGQYSIFGDVVSGMDAVKELEKFGTPDGPTTKKLVIEKATVSVEPKAKPAEPEKSKEPEKKDGGEKKEGN